MEDATTPFGNVDVVTMLAIVGNVAEVRLAIGNVAMGIVLANDCALRSALAERPLSAVGFTLISDMA